MEAKRISLSFDCQTGGSGMNEMFCEQISCPICNGESILIELVKTINTKSDMEVELRECIICRHWWHNPIPDQKYLSYLYEIASEFVVPTDYKNNIQMELNDKLIGFGSWIYNYEKRQSILKYLEIGVGDGQLFKYFLNKGHECHGIDPGNWNPNIELFPNMDALPYSDYDVICLSDVLEHLENPLQMLTELKKKSKKGTRIYCSFPNKDSIPAKMKKGAWVQVRPLGHLHYFSEQSVFNLFNKSGWNIESVRKVNAPHNEIFTTLDPLTIAKKIYNIPNVWKDEFWVKALSI